LQALLRLRSVQSAYACFVYDPLGTSPGYKACQCASWTLGYGVYAQAQGNAGPIAASLGRELGRNKNQCSNDLYSGATETAGIRDALRGISAEASAGGQL